MKQLKTILTLAAALSFGGFAWATPMVHNDLRTPTRISTTASDNSIVVLMIPLGDQALCAAGIQMPDCALDPYQPQSWLEVIEVDGVVVSQKIVTDPD